MSKPHHITVIVLHYNRLDLTTACVESCLQTMYPDFHILIFDNGSTDTSLSQLKKQYQLQKYISFASVSPNRGFAGGFNKAVQYVQRGYVVLLSNDMTVHPDWLTHLAKCIDTYPSSIIQPKIMHHGKHGHIDNVGGRYRWWGIGSGVGRGEIDRGQYDHIEQIDYATATTLMIDASVFLKLGGYDEWFWSHYEDVDLALRARKHSINCYLCPQSIMYHKGSMTYKSHVSVDITTFHIRKNMIRVICKNYTGITRIIRLGLVIIPLSILICKDFLKNDFKRSRLTITAIRAGLK